MTLHTASQKDRKAIVALADSFSQVIEIADLGVGHSIQPECLMRMPNNEEM